MLLLMLLHGVSHAGVQCHAMRRRGWVRWTRRGEVRTLAHTSAFKAVCVVRIEVSLWELGTLGLAFVRSGSGVGLKVCEICLS